MADIRYHNTEDMPAVILAPDGSVDAYGYVSVTDHRPPAPSYDALIKFVREVAAIYIYDGEFARGKQLRRMQDRAQTLLGLDI